MEAHEGGKTEHPELGLGDFLRELWQKKFLLAGLTLLAGVLAALYTLSLPNIFESSAALIVRPPQNASPGAEEAPTLSVETLQSLTEASETLWALFDSLWNKKALQSWVDNDPDRIEAFRSFQNAVTATLVERKSRTRGDAVELLPILELTAHAASPEEAQVIANEWAAIVEQKSRAIFTEGVTTLDDFVGDMYDKSNNDLIMAESDLAQHRLEAMLDLKNLRLTALKERIAALESSILNIQVEVAISEATIRDGSERLAEQYYGGDWIGSVAESALTQGDALPFDATNFSERAQRIVELTQRKVEQTERLRNYRKEQDVLAKENLYAHYEAYAGSLLKDISALQDKLPPAEEFLASVSRMIEEVPEKLVLDKAITDNALWNAYLEGDASNDKVRTPLKTEVLNPLYQSMREGIVNTSTEIERSKTSIAYLSKNREENDGQMLALHLELDRIQQETERLEKDKGTTIALLDMFREELVAENKKIEQMRVENLRKQEEMRVSEELRDQFVEEVKGLEEEVTRTDLELEILARDVEKTQNVRSALAAKAESTALLRVAAESASRTGTAILYQAQADPDKVAPRRTVITLAAMMATCVLGAALVCMARIVRETA